MNNSTDNPRIRIGIIGCGEVAQVNHFPSLKFLADIFEVIAISDVSASVLEEVGNLHQVKHRFLEYRDLLALPEVDAVLISTPNAYHTEQTLAALEHGKHVLVEKPMSMTLPDSDAIIAAQAKTGLVVQVGYIRRHATAFKEAVARVKTLKDIKLARVHDVLGFNHLMVQNTSRVIRGNDVPESVIGDLNRLNQQKLQEVLGDATPEVYSSYNILLSLSTHDISAMRELLGMPKQVLYAAQRSSGLFISAAFDYGDFICQFETGIDGVARFDCHLEVYAAHQTLRVEYNTPYVRHLATRLSIITGTENSELKLETTQPAFEDNFTNEWLAFYESVTTGKPPKTNPADYRHDLEIFMQMLEHLRKF